jgi:hypothetical protein
VASPTGIIPEEFFDRSKLGAVMEYLKGLPLDGDRKELLLAGWARWVGVRLNASQRAAVRNTGVDR